MVKAGEDDGELINSRDRSWPNAKRFAGFAYSVCLRQVMLSNYLPSWCQAGSLYGTPYLADEKRKQCRRYDSRKERDQHNHN